MGNNSRAKGGVIYFDAKRFEKALEVTGLNTPEDLLNYALTLICWAAEQAKTGRVIVGLNETSGRYRELSMPFLDKLKDESGRN